MQTVSYVPTTRLPADSLHASIIEFGTSGLLDASKTTPEIDVPCVVMFSRVSVKSCLLSAITDRGIRRLPI